MSDFKSKLPDLKELASMTGKLFNDLKSSVIEIVNNCRKKREVPAEAAPATKPVVEKEAVKKATKPQETTESSETNEPTEEADPKK